jgi:paraquat-inducible protein A
LLKSLICYPMHSLPLIACPECDLLQQEGPVPLGGSARCRRCDALLYRSNRNGLEATLAFTLAAIPLFLVANAFPLMMIEVQGSSNTTTLLGAVHALTGQGREWVAALVAITTMVIPALQLAALTYILLPLHFGRVPRWLGPGLHLLDALRPWSMMEVFVLGLLVALARLSFVASVVPGVALWSFGGFVILLLAGAATFSIRDLWVRVAAIR